MKKIFTSKADVLMVLVATMGVASVLMNVFAGFRPFYTEGSHGVWRAVSFSTIAVSWIPFLVGDILADRYSKKVAFGIPAFIFAIQALVWIVAILLDAGNPQHMGKAAEGWQNLWAGIAGNYAGLAVNLFVFLGLKKLIGTDNWLTFATVAIASTVFGQLADNTFYMALSPFQWASDVLEGGRFINFAVRWETLNVGWENGVWNGDILKVNGERQLGWDSMFLKSAFEIGVEAVVYPLTFLLTRFIKSLPDYNDSLVK